MDRVCLLLRHERREERRAIELVRAQLVDVLRAELCQVIHTLHAQRQQPLAVLLELVRQQRLVHRVLRGRRFAKL